MVVFLPVGDIGRPKRLFPVINYALIITNILVFFMKCFPEPSQYMLLTTAFIPAEPDIWAMFFSMFLHANILHLFGNMLFLFIFGDNVEDRLGHIGYLAFYFVCGVVATLIHTWFTETPEVPIIGASGAIAGVLGAYLVLFPHNKVKLWYFIWLLIFIRTGIVALPALVVLGLWFVEQMLFALYLPIASVAYHAHVGGFIAGMIVGLFCQPRHA